MAHTPGRGAPEHAQEIARCGAATNVSSSTTKNSIGPGRAGMWPAGVTARKTAMMAQPAEERLRPQAMTMDDSAGVAMTTAKTASI